MTPGIAEFLHDLIRGLSVNFEIAGLSLLLGLVVSLPFIAARLRGGVVGSLAGMGIALMWAAPTFIVMFFLANVLPRTWIIDGHPIYVDDFWIVVVSLAIFSTAYITDNGLDAIRHFRRGDQGSALLLLPQLARVFFVLITSSSQAAALGVPEAVSVTLRRAYALPLLWHRLLLFLGVVLIFVIIQRTAFWSIDIYRARLLGRQNAAS